MENTTTTIELEKLVNSISSDFLDTWTCDYSGKFTSEEEELEFLKNWISSGYNEVSARRYLRDLID